MTTVELPATSRRARETAAERIEGEGSRSSVCGCVLDTSEIERKGNVATSEQRSLAGQRRCRRRWYCQERLAMEKEKEEAHVLAHTLGYQFFLGLKIWA